MSERQRPSWLEALLRPVPQERQDLNSRRWQELPESMRRPEQVLGRWHHACGATHGLHEGCNFACTSCYLSSSANAAPPLPEEEVRAQLDALRGFLGPHGKAQLTSGEVTLLPLETLGGYVRYAREIGLDPMVMTNGQRLLDDPAYLHSLVADYGLRKIAIHVDSTQRGRDGWHQDQKEHDLNKLRQTFADLIRQTRRQTGKTLYAAHTVTVTRENLDQVPRVMEWVSENCDAFRLVSFQPVAEVGRTQDKRPSELTGEAVWDRVCHGLGVKLNPRAMLFGHPECTILAPLLQVRGRHRTRFVEAARTDKAWDRRFLMRLMDALGGFSTIDTSPLRSVLSVLSITARNLPLVAETVAYGAYRFWGMRTWAPQLVWAAAAPRSRLRPMAVVVHRFMSPHELDTDLGQERLRSCAFKVPVNGYLIPMCELNATSRRSELNMSRNLPALPPVAGCNLPPSHP